MHGQHLLEITSQHIISMAKTTVLMTGATGSLGASTLAQLLENPNFIVHAVLRSSARSEAFLRKKYASQVSSGHLVFVEIPDMTVPGAFDEPARQVDAIMHIATPLCACSTLARLITFVHHRSMEQIPSERYEKMIRRVCFESQRCHRWKRVNSD